VDKRVQAVLIVAAVVLVLVAGYIAAANF